jgi:putative phage-type endonuclease
MDLNNGSELRIFKSREEWLEARAVRIGSSEAAAACGEDPWTTELTLHLRKRGLAPAVEDNERMRWGRLLEPVVAEEFAEETGRAIIDPGRNHLYLCAAYPWAHASIDRAQRMDGAKGLGILEIKTGGSQTADKWDDGPPHHYMMQIQHQFAVTGLTWGSFAVLLGGNDFRWCDVDADTALIEKMMSAERRFYEAWQSGDPPSASGGDAETSALAAAFKQAEKTVELTADVMEADAVAVDAAEREEAAKQERTKAQNEIRLALGTAEEGILPNGVRYTWKATTKGVRVLRRHEKRSQR